MATRKKTTTKKAAAKKAATKKRTPAKSNGKARARKPRKSEKLHPRKLRGKILLECRNAALELELKRQKLQNTIEKLNMLSRDPVHDPVFLLLGKKDALVKEVKAETQAWIEMQKKVAEKFNIPFEDLHLYTFDTDAGAIILKGAST